jgi:hypothetical protein
MALRMRRFCRIGGLALALAAAPCSFAQKQKPTLESFFPDRFGPWRATNTPSKVKPTEEQYPLLQEAGWSDSFALEYSNGPQRVGVLMTQFRDPTGAYEAYTARISPDMHPSIVGELSGVDHDRLVMLIGNVLLEVSPPQIPSTAELQELARSIKKYADTTPLPPVRAYLPEGFSDGTQRYSLGPAGFRAALERLHRTEYSALAAEVGFDNGAETMLAEYRKRDDAAVVVLIEYPTPQLAEQHMHHLQTILPGIAKAGEAKIARTGSLLSMVLGATTPAYAASLRSAINYETQVTWNEPTHTLTDPPWLVIVSRIFTATGIFLVIAIVLGVAFGGLRVVTKRLFPGKVFDRPKDIEVLQLGLSGKRVDSDFS